MMPPKERVDDIFRLRWLALAVGLLLLALSLAAVPANSILFLSAYLAAYLFYLGLTLGSLTLLMIYHLTGGAWGFLIRRLLEAAVRTLPLVAMGFVPIALGVPTLYPWAVPSLVAGDPSLQHAHAYLNPPAFWARAAAYFVTWLLVGMLLNFWSRQQDTTRNPKITGRLRTLSGLGLVSYGVGLNFASADWVMSLQPSFHSTIFGPLLASGHLMSALALAIVLLAWLKDRPPLARAISADAINDLGSLLFAFVVVWSYMVWFQFMLIWIANLPVDVIWYMPRSIRGWQHVSLAVFGGAFLIPLFLLLLKAVKRNLTILSRVAGLIVLMQLVYDFYLVIPSTAAAEVGNVWMAILLSLGLGGIWVACLLWQLGRRPLLPACDFNQNEALRLRAKHDREQLQEEALAHG
jgi:hypothetical protein